MEDLWFLKLLTCAHFKRQSTEVRGLRQGGRCCCLHLFYCIQIMDGLISASLGDRERESASLSIQMCIVNERINDGN